ncbi:MAG: LPS export ABC transporter periplasmic protein LptC [Gammaproteobacteria bacterium]|nr:LPS export ABC transporter periplasmic protein LptC [Gammaproteobacteria bacterium]MDP2140217.1 LPS export ABC transporter periplasmic protein LptC [Gammaproteobacteria bacterium]MDP2348093.1 LPS export ABC transporter periplasmic protein LptC [Gammaproteobacteria bacterium]
MTTPSPTSSENITNQTSARSVPGSWRVWMIISLGALAFFIGREVVLDPPISSRATDATTQISYDAYSFGVSSVLYNADGRIEYTLEASEQIHYLDNTTVLTNPFVQLYQDSGARWNIAARSGRILGAAESDDIVRLDLSNEVELFQIDEQGSSITLTTEFISIYPDTETMDTDHEVTMTTANLRQTALGMRADINQDKLTFLSQVRGRYEVESSQP